MADSWRFHRVNGVVVGRGGLSRTPVDDDWGQLYAHSPRTQTGSRSDGRYGASSGDAVTRLRSAEAAAWLKVEGEPVRSVRRIFRVVPFDSSAGYAARMARQASEQTS
jgi:hypothetical protein